MLLSERSIRKDIKARFASCSTNGFREFSPARSYRLRLVATVAEDAEDLILRGSALVSIQLVARALSPQRSVNHLLRVGDVGGKREREREVSLSRLKSAIRARAPNGG